MKAGVDDFTADSGLMLLAHERANDRKNICSLVAN